MHTSENATSGTIRAGRRSIARRGVALGSGALLATGTATALLTAFAGTAGANATITVDSSGDGVANAANCTDITPGNCTLRDAALAALQELSSSGIRHAHALRLALKVNQSARNWPEVLRLVHLLDKHNALHPTLSRRLRDLAYEALLPKAAEDAESLKKLWTTIPAVDRQSAAVASLGATAFMKIGRQQDAADILQKALAVQWDVRLLRAYRQCAAPEGSATLLSQIEHVEQWLRERPNDAELALLLGALCQKQKLWGKAQRHLEQAVLGASDRITLQEAHLRLAQMYEVLGQPEAAATHFRLCALTTQVPNSKSSK